MTDRQRLKLISSIVESDDGFEADMTTLDKKATKEEKLFSNMLIEIYRIVHPRFSKCIHPDWEEKTENKFNNLK